MPRKGVVITIQLDIPDLASVRYERDVLDMIGECIPWDRLPKGSRLMQARKMPYTINDDGKFSNDDDQG